MPIDNAKVHVGQLLTESNISKGSDDPLELDGIDYIEIYAENARECAFYFCHAFGLKPVAYRGPETKFPDSASYVLQDNKLTLVITGSLKSSSAIAASIFLHGTTVKDIALRVPNCPVFFAEAVRRGAKPVLEPHRWEDTKGSYVRASIQTYGETVHSIVERGSYTGAFAPGYVPYEELFPAFPKVESVGLLEIDHVVGNVELGRMQTWVEFYEKVLGFKEMAHFSDEDISTEYSALMSKVVRDGSGKVKFPINEPAEGKRKSQIEEYLNFHNGPGVQHIAIKTDNIIETVEKLRRNGVFFLRVPKNYYDEIPVRVGSIKEDLSKIAALGILVDRDDDGYLLQLFTKPIHDRPTLFLEIIQREGSQGFGKGNFKALFEAIEREQAARGNL